MGHKVNPISLRLHTNRSFDSSWYSEQNYGNFVAYDMYMRAYVRAIYASANMLPGRILSHAFPAHNDIYLFFSHMPGAAPRTPSGTPRVKHQKPLALETQFLCTHAHKSPLHLQARHALLAWNSAVGYTPSAPQVLDVSLFETAAHPRATMHHVSKNSLRALHTLYAPTPYRSHIESHLSSHTQVSTHLYPLRLHRMFQSADTVAFFVAKMLEQKKSFRAIWKMLVTTLGQEKYSQKGRVQGLRLSCAGRIGGAEMARIEYKKWGQTSLHVFSNKIDYATHTAQTVYGLIGVKVWICYS